MNYNIYDFKPIPLHVIRAHMCASTLDNRFQFLSSLLSLFPFPDIVAIIVIYHLINCFSSLFQCWFIKFTTMFKLFIYSIYLNSLLRFVARSTRLSLVWTTYAISLLHISRTLVIFYPKNKYTRICCWLES